MDDEAFWLSHLRLGLAIFTTAIAVTAVYLGLGSPPRPAALAALAVVAAASVVGVAVLPHRRIVASRHRNTFFFSWTAFSVGFCLLVAAVDGGGGSPLALLLVLPVMYSGLAYPPFAVVCVVTASVAGYLSLAVAGPTTPAGDAVLLTGTMVCVGLGVAAVARNRQRVHAGLLALHRQLEEAARRDGLTGCLTRGAFHEAVAAELARGRRRGRASSIVIVDLDDFKAVNDHDGHLAGDAVLETVGNVLRASLRAGDAAGRLGGDELAILLAEAGPAAAGAAAERIHEHLRSAGVHASLGIATTTADDVVESVLARADVALYQAKRAGKDRIVTAPNGHHEPIRIT